MKQDIKNKEPQERQTYVSPIVKVIEVAAQRIICTSDGRETPDLNPDTPYQF